MADPKPDAEVELERFRQKWREEVSARSSRSDGQATRDVANVMAAGQSRRPVAGPSKHSTVEEQAEATEPRSYHDLPHHDEATLSSEPIPTSDIQPTSALEHYERAVERETQGQLGDSVRHYRRAFKLDDGVHEAYKKKHFPPPPLAATVASAQTRSAARAVSNGNAEAAPLEQKVEPVPLTIKQLLDEFSSLRIEPPPPFIEGMPPGRSYLGELPEEILTGILMALAEADIAAYARLAQVCRRLAYLVMTEDTIWRTIALGREVGFTAMHYDFACNIDGTLLEPAPEIPVRQANISNGDAAILDDVDITPMLPEEREIKFVLLSEQLLQSRYAMSWRNMFRMRPRIRFNGCYISTVNYTRAGGANTNSLTWGVPVHIVTYYRYLRFFRDGAVLSLLTTAEPADVVHHLTKSNVHSRHRNNSMLPSAVMKDALRGRWRLSGPSSSSTLPDTNEAEVEGDVHIETEGVVSRYTYRMHFAMSHAGKSTRNNKLAWRGFWSYNRLADDWAEFSLRNDRAFYWSRVKSYHESNE